MKIMTDGIVWGSGTTADCGMHWWSNPMSVNSDAKLLGLTVAD